MNWLKSAMVAGAVVCAGLPAVAQTCAPLRVVEGKGTSVQKSVSVPSTPVSPSNWNTDFAVSGRYSSYAATIRAKNGGDYTIEMNLKYPNGTADNVYKQKINLKDGQAITITGSPRLNADPYQVNLSVGGVPVVGNTYTVTASGCR